MTLNLNVPKAKEQLSPQITVIGVGGAGGNAVNNMIQSSLEGVEFLVTNTDSQALAQTLCERTIQLGRNITQGLGAGSRPDIGRAAAEEALDEILGQLEGSNMVFVTAGMGGGTGTGAAPVLARAARESGILTVGVVTKPFHFEGVHRMRLAESGIAELQQYVDTLIVIPNQNLFRVANEKTTFADAFKMADDVLDSGVRGVTDLMVMPGLINLDFADIRAVMSEMGKAMMGTGEAEGENRAIDAAEAAISNPLLDDVSMKGARGVLINITGGADMTLFEVDEAANRIRDEVDPEANIIFGSTFVESIEGRMRVSVVATGIDAEEVAQPRPVSLSIVTNRSEAQSNGSAEPAQTPASVIAAAAGAYRSRARTFESEAAGDERGEPESILEDDTKRGPVRGLIRSEESLEPDEDEVESDEPFETATPFKERGPEPLEPDEGEDEMGERFIAPTPAEPETKTQLVADARIRPEPFAEAELTNGSRTRPGNESGMTARPGRKKAHSLFAKVSGAARAFHNAAQSSAPDRSVPGAIEHQPVSSPSARSTAPRPVPEPARQPRLSGLDPAGRIGGGAAEDELLDIPAFLRRQAN